MSSRRSGLLLVIFAGAAFATSGPLARVARPFHPLGIACGRVALAALLLLLLDGGEVLASLRRMTGRQRAQVAGAGVLLGAHFALFLWGLDCTSLPAAVSLVSLEPLSVVVWAWAVHDLRPARLELLGVLTATVGAVVVAQGAGQGEHRLVGDLLVVGAVVLFGAYLVCARALREVLPARPYAALVYGSAALSLGLALAVATATGRVEVSALWPIQPHSALAVVALAVLPTLIGHTAVQSAARHLSPSVVALVSPGETVGGLAIAVALGAIPAPIEIAGAVLIVVGVTGALLGAR